MLNRPALLIALATSLVAALPPGPAQALLLGNHQITLDFSAHSAGLYFICAQHSGSSVVRKVMLLK